MPLTATIWKAASGTGERCRLECHLHGYGEAGARNKHVLARLGGSATETVAERRAYACAEEHREHGGRAEQSCRECAYAGACKAQLRRPEVAVDKHIVTRHIHHIGPEHYPGRQPGIVDRIAPLSQHIKEHNRQHACKHYLIVVLNQWHQMPGLPHPVEIEVHGQHYQRQQYGKGGVDAEADTNHAPYPVVLAACKHRAYERREAIGKAHACKNSDIEEVIDKRCRRKGLGGVLPHHYIVGKGHGDIAKLPYEERQGETAYAAIVLPVCR